MIRELFLCASDLNLISRLSMVRLIAKFPSRRKTEFSSLNRTVRFEVRFEWLESFCMTSSAGRSSAFLFHTEERFGKRYEKSNGREKLYFWVFRGSLNRRTFLKYQRALIKNCLTIRTVQIAAMLITLEQFYASLKSEIQPLRSS